MALTWKKYWALNYIFKGLFNNEHKCQISCILPTLTYGCQVWSLTQKHRRRLKCTQNALERSMLKIKRKDEIRNKTIKSKLKYSLNVIRKIKRVKWKWAGHLARIEDSGWTYKLTVWFLKHHKRKKDRETKCLMDG